MSVWQRGTQIAISPLSLAFGNVRRLAARAFSWLLRTPSGARLWPAIIAAACVAGLAFSPRLTGQNALGWYVATIALAGAALCTLLHEVIYLYRRLVRSESRFRSLIEQAPAGTCIVDEQGRFEIVNAMYAALYGSTPNELLGKPFTTIVPEPYRGAVAAQLSTRLTDQEGTSGEIDLVDHEGRQLTMRATAVSLAGADGRPRRASFIMDITEQKLTEHKLTHAAHHDLLTGLPNRALFGDRIEQAMLTAERQKATLAVLLIDLNRFKEVNDTLGHAAGDQVLTAIAARMRVVLRASDTVARLGGDEFAVLLPGADEAGALHVANKICGAAGLPIRINNRNATVGASIGIALYPEHAGAATALLQHADAAMYSAKAAGGGAVVYALADDQQGSAQLTLAGEMRQAIGGGQLRLHYQPVVECASGLVGRVEALVRWQHPTRNLLGPDYFIPLAEQTGAIDALSAWVLEEALRQCRSWHDEGLALGVAVNVSMHTLQDAQFPDMVSALLRAYDVSPAQLTLEVSERALLTHPDRALQALGLLAGQGVRIAIDDFGSGQSSLSTLRRLRAHELKVDRSFVQQADTENGAALVSFMLGLGAVLGLQVTVEGIENQATLDWLVSLGCQAVQGFHLQRPLPAAELEQWLRGATRQAIPARTAGMAAGAHAHLIA